MENEINLDDFKLQVNKIVQLLSSYSIPERLEAFNYFFKNINFVFPLFTTSQDKCFIEPNLKISLVLLKPSPSPAPSPSPSSAAPQTTPTKLSSDSEFEEEINLDQHHYYSNNENIAENTPESEDEPEHNNITNDENSIICRRRSNRYYGNFQLQELPKLRNFSINLKRLNIPTSALGSTRQLSDNNFKFIINSRYFNFKKSIYISLRRPENRPKRILAIESSESKEVLSLETPKTFKIEPISCSDNEDVDEPKKTFVLTETGEATQLHNLIDQNQQKKVKIKSEQRFKCLQCDKVYRKKKSLMGHCAHHHPGFCPICGQYYGQSPREVGEHNKTFHIKEFPFICDECGESFKRNQQFKIHLDVHDKKRNDFIDEDEKKKTFKCTLCSLEFKGFKCYEKHVQDCHKLEGFMCEQCGAHFKKKIYLHQHNFKVHKKEVICPICNKSFSNKSNLDRHLLLHTETTKSFICEQCGAAYYSPVALKEHNEYAHKETKEFVCEICKKGFTVKRALQRHQLVHSDDRPFHCNVCTRSFKIKSNLVRHKQLTHKEEPAPSNRLARYIKTEDGELIEIQESPEPKPKRPKKKRDKTKNVNSNIPQQQQQQQQNVIADNNYIQIINNDMQYPMATCSNTQNMEMLQINSNINSNYVNPYGGGNDQLDNSINNLLLQTNDNPHGHFNNEYTQNNYNMPSNSNVWNNVTNNQNCGEYSLVGVTPENFMSFQLKPTNHNNRNDNQIMDIPNTDLIHYQDIWNTGNSTQMEYGTNVDPNSQQNNTYSNIGSILSNLEMMENPGNINESNNMIVGGGNGGYNLQQQPPQHQQQHHSMHHQQQQQQQQQHQQQHDSNEIKIPHLVDSHMNYDLNNQNHTITDISNTFIKEERYEENAAAAAAASSGNVSGDVNNPSSNDGNKPEHSNTSNLMITSNDVIDSIGLDQKQIKEILQNTNENVMLPSLIDYLQHPYQF